MISAGLLFNPACAMTIAGVLVPNLDGKGLRMNFSVLRTLDSHPDTAQVSIFNMGPERRKAAQALFGETGRVNLLIAAGYSGVVQNIFNGDVRTMRESRRHGPDLVLEAKADDGGDAIVNANIQVYGIPLRVDQMIALAVAKMNSLVPPVLAHPSVTQVIGAADPSVTQYQWSTTVNGRVSDLLDQACRLLDARWHLRNGLLHLSSRNLPVDAVPVMIPRTHWLSEVEDDGRGLTRLTTLFEPQLEPGRPVTVEGVTYRCEASRHTGDTHDGPWSTEMLLRRLA